MQLIHHSPLGPLEIPGVLGAPAPGEPFDVDDDIGETLLAQSDLYALATPDEPDKRTVPELRAIAESQGVDLTGLKKKPDIIAALEAAAAADADPGVIDEQATTDDEQTPSGDEEGDQQ